MYDDLSTPKDRVHRKLLRTVIAAAITVALTACGASPLTEDSEWSTPSASATRTSTPESVPSEIPVISQNVAEDAASSVAEGWAGSNPGTPLDPPYDAACEPLAGGRVWLCDTDIPYETASDPKIDCDLVVVIEGASDTPGWQELSTDPSDCEQVAQQSAEDPYDPFSG